MKHGLSQNGLTVTRGLSQMSVIYKTLYDIIMTLGLKWITMAHTSASVFEYIAYEFTKCLSIIAHTMASIYLHTI